MKVNISHHGLFPVHGINSPYCYIHSRHLDHSCFFQLEASQYLPLFLPASPAPLSGYFFLRQFLAACSYYSTHSNSHSSLSNDKSFVKCWQSGFAYGNVQICYMIMSREAAVTNTRTNTENVTVNTVLLNGKRVLCKLKILLTSGTVNKNVKEGETNT